MTSRSQSEAGGLELNYLDYGTEGLPPMLCIHGGAAHGHWFDFVAPGFTPSYHVRSLDLRGHGDSDPVDPPLYTYEQYASDIDKTVRALDLRDFVLMGHSMGGTVSLVYAATYPGRVKKLVVVDSTVNLSAERIGSFGRKGTMAGEFRSLHNIGNDSKGNIYTAEVGAGRRVQKFIRERD